MRVVDVPHPQRNVGDESLSANGQVLIANCYFLNNGPEVSVTHRAGGALLRTFGPGESMLIQLSKTRQARALGQPVSFSTGKRLPE